MQDLTHISNNINRVKAQLPKHVTIVSATKTVPSDIICKLPQMGITIAGENRVQEMLSKYPSAKAEGLSWHFIGQLQSNKVKYIIDKVDLIHSVDRFSLASEIQRQASKIGRVMPVLIEVNMGNEQSKGGVSPSQLVLFAKSVAELPNVRVAGLMSVMPVNAEEKMYLQMKQLYDKLKLDGFDMQYLSMGMSGDYLTAVECGANMVRLGSCLFGARA